MLTERLELCELIEVALRAADAAKIKGVVPSCPAATRCLDILKQIKGLSLSAKDICNSKTLYRLETLKKHGDPNIRSEARNLFDSWLRTLYASGRDDCNGARPMRPLQKKPNPLKVSGNLKSCVLKRDKNNGERSETQKEISMDKTELLELFEAAKKAADKANAKGILLGQAEASRCIDALSRLRTFPVSPRVLEANRIEERLERLTKHKNQRIRSSASTLLQGWRQSIRNQECQGSATKRKAGDRKTHGSRHIICQKLPKSYACSTRSDENAQSVPCTAPLKGKDESRDKIRDMLGEVLSRVPKEVKDENLKEKVRQCSPVKVAFEVEAVMFEKMGPFNGKMKNKYRSIMYNLRDPTNPDLRRNVLLGQVTPERLIEMRSEEMASSKMQAEIDVLKKRAFQREKAKIKVADDIISSTQEECFVQW